MTQIYTDFFQKMPMEDVRNAPNPTKGCIPNGMQVAWARYFLPSDAFFFDKLKASPNGMLKTRDDNKPHKLV